ncbi:MAG: protein translocase subunit SecD [candidate division NC10 bacterium]|nr:protein translocase subunit SecD [candidate division NC10 bacterium]
MKQAIGWRLTALLLCTGLSLLYLFPSLVGPQRLPSWWRYVRPFLVTAPPEPINLGLDLQGGMHLVLEVDAGQAVANTVLRRAAELRRALEREGLRGVTVEPAGGRTLRLRFADPRDLDRAETVLGAYREMTRAAGGEPGELRLTVSDAEASRIAEAAVEQNVEKIRNRVDQFGVAEPLIQREGGTRIVVQLPGIKEPQRAINLIGQTALLEFKLVDDRHSVEEALAGTVPEGSQILYEKVVDEKGNVVRRTPYLIERQTLLTGDTLTSAEVRLDRVTNEPYVGIEFDREGARIFAEVTEKNVGRRLAIILDNTVYSAPRINEKIPGGQAQITGRFTVEEARDLAIVLRAGALPAPVNIIANLTVGPSLGQDSIAAGLRASLLGGLLVIVLMAAYYRGAGLIADGALVLNLVLLLGALAMIRATLTLPGIAGIALTIGMAVDTNVLIFERIREELRLGKTVRAGIDTGYEKAWVAIIDSHVTTLITAFALFLFGSGPVKGFAVTLSLGVIINLFTAIVGTKVVFDWLTRRWQVRRLSI